MLNIILDLLPVVSIAFGVLVTIKDKGNQMIELDTFARWSIPMEFSPLTRFLIRWYMPFFLVLVAVLIVVWSVIVYSSVKRSTLRNEPSLWNNIKIPLLVTFLPLLACWNIWFHTENLALVLVDIVNTICVIAFSIGLFSAFLWYKGLFAFKRLRSFILGHCIGFACFIAIFLSFSKGYDFLLSRDPALKHAIELFNQRQVQVLEEVLKSGSLTSVPPQTLPAAP